LLAYVNQLVIVAVTFRSCLADEDEANDERYYHRGYNSSPREAVNQSINATTNIANNHDIVA